MLIMVELVGSPKQIAWAEKLRKYEIESVQKFQVSLKNGDFNTPVDASRLLREISTVELCQHPKRKEIVSIMVETALAITDKMMNKLENESSAKWFIGHRGYGSNLDAEFKQDIVSAVMKVW
jgi:hypothetical protein